MTRIEAINVMPGDKVRIGKTDVLVSRSGLVNLEDQQQIRIFPIGSVITYLLPMDTRLRLLNHK